MIVGAKAGIATIVQLTGSYINISHKFFGPSKHSSKDLKRISTILYSLNSFVIHLQTHHQLHEDAEIRLLPLSLLKKPLSRYRRALKLVHIRLNSMSPLEKQGTGARFDSKLNKAMDITAESNLLFDVALQSNQM